MYANRNIPSHHLIQSLALEDTFCGNFPISDVPFLPYRTLFSCFQSLNIEQLWRPGQNSTLGPSEFTLTGRNYDDNKKQRTTAQEEPTTSSQQYTGSFPLPAAGIRNNQALEYLQRKSSTRASKHSCPHQASLHKHSVNGRLLSKTYRIMSPSDKTLFTPTAKWETDLTVAPDANFCVRTCQNIS